MKDWPFSFGCAPLLVLATCGMSQAVPLDILSNCGLQALLSDIVHRREAVSCRPASGELERTLLRRSAPGACVIEPVPPGLADGSSCILEPVSRDNATLTCARSRPLAEVADYKRDYAAVHAGPVASYLDAAARCAASSGDSALAAPTQLFGPLLTSSRLEFGFVTMLAERDGTILHGLVSTDPSIDTWNEEALEVVQSFSNNVRYEGRHLDRARADRLRNVELDDGRDIKAHLGRMLASVPVPLYFDFAGFSMTSGYKQARALERANARSEGFSRLVTAVKDRLDEWGFVHVGGDMFRSTFGMSEEQLLASLASTRPYALGGQLDSNPTVGFYMRESDRCHASEGGTLAALAEHAAAAARPGEYGDVAVIVVAGGACLEDDREEARALVSALLEDVKPEVED